MRTARKVWAWVSTRFCEVGSCVCERGSEWDCSQVTGEAEDTHYTTLQPARDGLGEIVHVGRAAAARCLQIDGVQRGRQATKTEIKTAGLDLTLSRRALTPWGTTRCHSPGLDGVMKGSPRVIYMGKPDCLFLMYECLVCNADRYEWRLLLLNEATV